MQYKILPGHLYPKDNRINLYYFHNLLKVIGESVALQLSQQHKISVPITTGMWGGSYMVAQDDGQAKTNVVRLYSIVNLPQNNSLNKTENFECLMEIYQHTLHTTFKRYGLNLVDPRWGEAIPYSNRELPTTALQMWDKNKKINFVRAFFVWNEATWEESIIYDMIRNIKVLKELLNINTRPQKHVHLNGQVCNMLRFHAARAFDFMNVPAISITLQNINPSTNTIMFERGLEYCCDFFIFDQFTCLGESLSMFPWLLINQTTTRK